MMELKRIEIQKEHPNKKIIRRLNVLMPGDKLELTCGNCQLICHPDKDVRKLRCKTLVESGVVVQNPDGSLEAVSPEEGKMRIEAMDPKTRVLYEEI